MSDNYSTSFASWPDCTFTWEPEDQDYLPGSHWDPFYENIDSLVDELPTIIGSSLGTVSYSDGRPVPRKVPAEWPKGVHLCWPNNNRGLITTFTGILRSSSSVDKEGGELLSLYPFFSEGIQASIEIRQVFVLNRAETLIEGSWGQSHISFFDTQFFSNCAWYKAGEAYDFILSGIAYEAKPAEVREISITPETRQILALEESAPPVISMEDAAMFLPITEWNQDDYWFHGPVLEVKPFSKERFGDMLGQSGWQIRVIVMRFDEEYEDAELKIVVTQRAWSGSEPPKVGQNVEGRLWLQGYLWNAQPQFNPVLTPET